MTDDELKALCESNAKAIQAMANSTSSALQGTNATLDRIAAQQTTHTDEIDTLLGAVSSNEVACRELRQTVETLVSDVGEGNQRFDNLRADAIADRQSFREQAEADRQAFREALEIDRAEWRQRFNAQQEVIQTLLAQLVATNQDVAQTKNNVSGLSDRVDGLEQAS